VKLNNYIVINILLTSLQKEQPHWTISEVLLRGTSPRHNLHSTLCSGRLPLALQGTKPPPAEFREYRDEEAIERRLLHREHILLTDPPPEFGESPEFE
jgi:hypothetical protein